MQRSSTKRGRLQRLVDWLRRLRNAEKAEPPTPGDPYAYRLAPVRRGPKGRSGAAAVAEPDEE